MQTNLKIMKKVVKLLNFILSVFWRIKRKYFLFRLGKKLEPSSVKF
jgi:hypothetical protein